MPDETPKEPPRGPIAWFAAAIGEALQAAFGIAIALVAGIFKALFGGSQTQEEDEKEP
jgi:hypothetical protein